MKLIFLDIDGVLNRTGRPEDGRTMPLYNSGIGWDPQLVPQLAKILNAFRGEIAIVISSSWRVIANYQPALFSFAFATWGISVPVLGCTPSCQASDPMVQDRRGLEIQMWLDQWKPMKVHHAITSYVVLDDCHDAGAGHEDKFVQTIHSKGLTDDNVAKAIAILKRQEER